MTSSKRSSCTYRRDPAVHTWPWLKKMPSAAAWATCRGSASGSTMCGDLPPSSRETFLRLPVAALATSRPDRGRTGEGHLVHAGVGGDGAADDGPGPVTTLRTPGGRPASWHSSASRSVDSDVSSAGLRTTVLPVASAGASFQAAIDIGKFHGTIAPTTPTGSCTV